MKLSRLLDRLRRETPPPAPGAAAPESEARSHAPTPPSPSPSPSESAPDSKKRKRGDEAEPSVDLELEQRRAKLLASLAERATVEPGPQVISLAKKSKSLDFTLPDIAPYHLRAFVKLGDDDNFIKSVKWSPDGLCLLSSTNDRRLRLYELPHANSSAGVERPSWNHVLEVKEGDDIYDCDWYPRMTSTEPSTCAFVSSSKSHPLHLWDAFTGKRRATYYAYDNVHEPVAAISCAFTLDGSKVIAGYNKEIRIFDVADPGKAAELISTVPKKRSQNQFSHSFAPSVSLNGVVSSIACSESQIALGSFNSQIGLLDVRALDAPHRLTGHKGGITHLKWSSDGLFLYSGSRKENSILCWDVRQLHSPLFSLSRVCATNQRMSFDLSKDNTKLFTGDQEGHLLVYDVRNNGKLESKTKLQNDCINSVQVHPSLPLLALGSGQRRFRLSLTDSDDKEGAGDDDNAAENIISLVDFPKSEGEAEASATVLV